MEPKLIKIEGSGEATEIFLPGGIEECAPDAKINVKVKIGEVTVRIGSSAVSRDIVGVVCRAQYNKDTILKLPQKIYLLDTDRLFLEVLGCEK